MVITFFFPPLVYWEVSVQSSHWYGFGFSKGNNFTVKMNDSIFLSLYKYKTLLENTVNLTTHIVS